MLHAHTIVWLLVIAIAALGAICDQRTGLIPNRLTISGLAVLLLSQLAFGALSRGASGVWMALVVSVLGLLACALIPLAIFLSRGMGGGDVKLLAVCGVGLGPVLGLEAQLYAFGLGALYALALAAYDGVLLQTLSGSTALLTNPLLPARLKRPVAASASMPIRFGPAIGVGVAVAVAMHWNAA
jgi:prepilin peptidase CpaA